MKEKEKCKEKKKNITSSLFFLSPAALLFVVAKKTANTKMSAVEQRQAPKGYMMEQLDDLIRYYNDRM